MNNNRISHMLESMKEIVGSQNVLSKPIQIKSFSTGIRIGFGKASAVIRPMNLIQFWRILKLCIELDKIIIIQAANTSLTGGSIPDGNDYDRDVVIISTLYMDKLILLNSGEQILALPGSTLSGLEAKLLPLKRESPHLLAHVFTTN